MGKIESALTENDEWGTPSYLLDQIVRVLGPIGLDPCSHPDAAVPCTTAILLPGYAPRTTNPYATRTVYADGLEIVWRGHGLVYLNPPYSEPHLKLFLEKCVTDGDEAVALVPVRTGNVYWPKAAGKADVEVRLPRVTFRGKPLPPGKKHPHAPFHSMLLYFGDRVEVALGLGVLGEVRVHPRHSLFRPSPGWRLRP